MAGLACHGRLYFGLIPLSTDSFLKTIDLVVKDPLREQSWGLDPGLPTTSAHKYSAYEGRALEGMTF